MTDIAIVGGGIGGLCTAIGLEDAGFEPVVYEAASELRPVGAGVLVPPNGASALDRLGVADDVVRAGRTAADFEIRTLDGGTLLRLDFEEIARRLDLAHAGVVLHRATLQGVLLDHIEATDVHTGAECVAVDPDGPVVRFADGTEREADLVVGADGVGSTVRRSIDPDAAPRFAGEIAFRGVCSDEAPPEGQTGIELWGEGDRFGWSRIDDGRVYWYATMPATTPDAGTDTSPSDLVTRFERFGAPATDFLEATGATELVRTPLSDLPSLGLWSRDSVTLLGDAAHATTPNLGQGAAQAMEDAACLSVLIDEHGPTPRALSEYEAARRARTRWLVRRSRLLGRVARIDRPVLSRVRDTILGAVPTALTRRQLDRQFTPVLCTDADS